MIKIIGVLLISVVTSLMGINVYDFKTEIFSPKNTIILLILITLWMMVCPRSKV